MANNTEKKCPVELYNLKDDIGETNELIAKYSELTAKVEKLFEEAHVPSEHYLVERKKTK